LVILLFHAISFQTRHVFKFVIHLPVNVELQLFSQFLLQTAFLSRCHLHIKLTCDTTQPRSGIQIAVKMRHFRYLRFEFSLASRLGLFATFIFAARELVGTFHVSEQLLATL
jgi:hypothetical protein